MRHWFQSRPWRLSAKLFCQGLSARVKAAHCRLRHSRRVTPSLPRELPGIVSDARGFVDAAAEPSKVGLAGRALLHGVRRQTWPTAFSATRGRNGGQSRYDPGRRRQDLPAASRMFASCRSRRTALSRMCQNRTPLRGGAPIHDSPGTRETACRGARRLFAPRATPTILRRWWVVYDTASDRGWPPWRGARARHGRCNAPAGACFSSMTVMANQQQK